MYVLAVIVIAAVVYLSNMSMAGARTWRDERCRYGNLTPVSQSYRTIDCAVDHWSVPGGRTTAHRIASCESGHNPYAENSYSSASGVFQIIRSTWLAWKMRFNDYHPWWDAKGGVFHARSNVLVAVWAAHLYGWSPWSCY
jgi:hypothetical protein